MTYVKWLLAPMLASSTLASADSSSARKDELRGQAEIPVCAHSIGTLAVVPPDQEWWRELNLGSPEAIIKVFVRQSGCFIMLNRDRALQSRNIERALADSGELRSGSHMGKGQVKTADYFLQPDIVSTNRNSGGGSAAGAIGGLLGHVGGLGRTVGVLAGGINVKKGEATVTLSLVNARSTEEEALTEGYARKTDVSWGGAGAAGWWSGFAAAGGYGYQNTEIGQVIVLAYLDAYKKLVAQLEAAPAPPNLVILRKTSRK